MALSIRTNISSITGQRKLADATSAVEKSLQRLSSGQRINSASDDAAGLSVANRLSADRRILTVAARNISDGISVLSVMDSTLESQSTILGRLFELAGQSANGSYTNTQRQSLDREYQQLIQELGRLADSTEFNGLSLLRDGRGGVSSAINIQVGTNGGTNSRINVAGIDVARFSGALDFSKLATIDWNQDGDSYDPDDVAAFSGVQSRETLLARLNNQAISVTTVGAGGVERELIVSLARDTSDIGLSVVAFLENPDGTFTATSQAIDNFSNLYIEGSGELLINQATGRLLTEVASAVQVNYGSGQSLTLDLSALLVGQNQQQTAIDFTGVSTRDQARSSLDVISRRLSDLSAYRGQIGSSQARLGVASNLVLASRDVLAGAESRIRDADVASESASLIRASILQQVTASVLAQANQAPQLALSLLRF